MMFAQLESNYRRTFQKIAPQYGLAFTISALISLGRFAETARRSTNSHKRLLMRHPLDVAVGLRAVSQIEIDEILIRDSQPIRHGLEILDHIGSKSNCHGLLEPPGVRVAPALHFG